MTPEDRKRYLHDGVVWLRGAFDPQWIEALTQGVNECDAQRSDGFMETRDQAEGPRRWGQVNVYRTCPSFARYVLDSPLGQIAAEVLGSETAILYVDHLFVKDAGCDEATPWHQDIQYFEVEGTQICSIWAAIDAVTEQTGALRFLRGSHRGPLYLATDFTADADPLPGQEGFAGPPPRFGEEPPGSEILCQPMEPGDCVIFHGQMVHSAFGAGSDRRRAALTVRLLGDDVRWAPRPHLSTHIDADLEPGEPLECETFPRLWPREVR